MLFNSQYVMITGAASGIGSSITELIIKEGAKVIGVGRDEEKLKSLKEKYPNNFDYEIKDLTEDIDSNVDWFSQICKDYGPIRTLILNAGSTALIPISSSRSKQSSELLSINYSAALSLIKAFVKSKNNIGEGASVVAISSISAHLGIKGLADYSASKAALNSLIRTASSEFSKKKIRFNSISAGHIETEMTKSTVDLEMIAKKYPLGLGSPEDVAELCVFLASNRSKWITGQDIVVDGGASIDFMS